MILIIEDNKTIAENIKSYLDLHGYLSEICMDGTGGLELAMSKHYDLIILDIMLPGMNGMEILQKLRKKKQVPVIMTTAKGEMEDKTEGFEYGADDYLVKPFELKELLLRVEAVLKRSLSSDIFTFNNIEINSETNEIFIGGDKVDLTNKEWLVLQCLLEQEGVPVSRSDISEFVWGGDSLRENDAKLDVYISTLRKKLDKELIETVKGFGYKIPKF